ncbi:hypothetical protein Tsubulata_004266 [Turnera subulata]|uniref:histidine kinase n=1 Tax=Turnera subulata TaxID=218843 RepID=A0A9Q0JDG6_9ROSI|nr:hypothetical protein Tsubulata_004266 [Turnera subulata]
MQTIGVLILPCIVTPMWYRMSQHVKEKVDQDAHKFQTALLSEIEKAAETLHPMTSSATNVARVIGSSINRSDPLPPMKVAPLFFQAFSAIPLVSQVSYIGLEGQFFSYYYEGNRTFAMYSNSTVTYPELGKYNCYRQAVDASTGNLYGVAVKLPSFTINASWIREVLNSNQVYASLGSGWSISSTDNHQKDPDLFLNSVSMEGKGVLSLGFPVKELVNSLNDTDVHGGFLYLAAKSSGEVLLAGSPNTGMVVTGDSVSFYVENNHTGDHGVGHHHNIGNVTCIRENGEARAPVKLNMGNGSYMVYCSPLEVLGVQLVYALALPYDGLEREVEHNSSTSLILLIVMIVAIIISVLSFVVLMARAASREMHLCNSLVKQMEATQQAERKSMNKSLAFATASHDIRAALAGITGLIEISYEEVVPGSEIETNLRQMDSCTKDLVGILNSILDTSKIEAGKMQLEEEEFDVATLLEDVVDLYHPVAIKKSVEVVLDPRDGSILQFSRVKGDRGKLKQVLCNLLSNAVKFTHEGHVSVRAWAQKPSLENKIIASNKDGWWKWLSSLFYKNKQDDQESETMKPVKQNPDAMEFFFEVADTGKGIPKDKQKSVFENFVQVKETALGQGGTGLGLGIVQSLVRLMGGDIGIVDKDDGERGACFRFNVFLTALTGAASMDNTKGDPDVVRESASQGSHQNLGTGLNHVRTPSRCLSIRTPSPRLGRLSPRTEGSHVILLIQNQERLRASQKFMEGLGLKVWIVDHCEQLHSVLMRIKYKQCPHPNSSSGNMDFGSWSESYGVGLKDAPLSSMDGIDQRLPSPRSTSIRGITGFVLLVLDATAAPFEELHRTVTEFKRGLHVPCKVVWLDKPTARGIDAIYLEEDIIDSDDDIMLKPFHGSRLYKVIKLLPEFGGQRAKKESRSQTRKVYADAESSSSRNHSSDRSRSKSKVTPSYRRTVEQGEIHLAESSSGRGKNMKRRSSSPDHIQTPVQSTSSHSLTGKRPVRLSEIQEEHGNLNSDKPLTGMKFLVAEDNFVLRKLAHENLLRLGATVKVCENGEEAMELVRDGLHEQMELGDSLMLPYDYILMDCQMPKMNGLEATRAIRREEKYFGVHIPIIALTAHDSGDEEFREAGMDHHLKKPLNRDSLLDVIRNIQRN